MWEWLRKVKEHVESGGPWKTDTRKEKRRVKRGLLDLLAWNLSLTHSGDLETFQFEDPTAAADDYEKSFSCMHTRLLVLPFSCTYSKDQKGFPIPPGEAWACGPGLMDHYSRCRDVEVIIAPLHISILITTCLFKKLFASKKRRYGWSMNYISYPHIHIYSVVYLV